jgi:glycosyltransferase involved in cell wall biosynthesis
LIIKRPLVSIVTVVFNSEKIVEGTLLSVLEQSYQNYEYIVIDGGSSDNTLNIIKKYSDSIQTLVSEKDFGIYDAMNKSIQHIKGEYVCFMNAGDYFYNKYVLKNIFENDIDGDVIYGDVEILYNDFAIVKKAGRPGLLWSGMQFSHQSAFVKSSFLRLTPFNVKNKISADLEFFYAMYLSERSFNYTNTVISQVTIGGVSERNRLRTKVSVMKAVCRVNGGVLIRLAYVIMLIDIGLRESIKVFLPSFVIKKIITIKAWFSK